MARTFSFSGKVIPFKNRVVTSTLGKGRMSPSTMKSQAIQSLASMPLKSSGKIVGSGQPSKIFPSVVRKNPIGKLF